MTQMDWDYLEVAFQWGMFNIDIFFLNIEDVEFLCNKWGKSKRMKGHH